MRSKAKPTLDHRAQTQSRAARKPIPLSERLAYSPAEFAAVLGKSPTFGYRTLYRGHIKAISNAGRLLIPRSEVDAFLAKAAQYNPVGTSQNETRAEVAS